MPKKRNSTKPSVASNPSTTPHHTFDSTSPTKTLYLIRHGESLGQAAKAMGLNRKTDPTLLDAGLTKKGKSQASSIPALMDVGDVDIVVISPLTRAFHTAILAFGNSTDVPVILNYDIREIGSGLPENRGRATRTVLRELSVGEDLIGRLSGVREDWPDAEEGGGEEGTRRRE